MRVTDPLQKFPVVREDEDEKSRRHQDRGQREQLPGAEEKPESAQQRTPLRDGGQEETWSAKWLNLHLLGLAANGVRENTKFHLTYLSCQSLRTDEFSL